MDDQSSIPETSPDGISNRAGSPSDELRLQLQRISEEIEKLQKNPLDKQRVVEVISEIASLEVTVGPYPPPQVLAEYERIIPGLARSIVSRAEKEQTFRHEIVRESAAQDRLEKTYAGRSRYLGQAGAIVIALAAIGGGVYSGQGIAAIIGTLVGLTSVFVVSKFVESHSARAREEADASEKSPVDPDGPR